MTGAVAGARRARRAMSGSDRDLVAALRAELAAIDPAARRATGAAEALGRRSTGRRAGRRGREAPVGPAARSAVGRDAAGRPADARPTGAAFDWDAARRPLPAGLAARPVPGPRLAEPRRRPDPSRVRRRPGRGAGPRRAPGRRSGCRRRGGSGGAAASSPGRAPRRSARSCAGSAPARRSSSSRRGRSRGPLRGELNRVLNAESANLQRAVGAAGRQLAAIDELEADGRLAEQPYVVRLVADARRETPEATLAELAERLELHRSARPARARADRAASPPRIASRGADAATAPLA